MIRWICMTRIACVREHNQYNYKVVHQVQLSSIQLLRKETSEVRVVVYISVLFGCQSHSFLEQDRLQLLICTVLFLHTVKINFSIHMAISVHKCLMCKNCQATYSSAYNIVSSITLRYITKLLHVKLLA